MAASALAEVLSVCGGIDNAKRKAGEERLKQISKSPEYLHTLLECAQACSDLQARLFECVRVGGLIQHAYAKTMTKCYGRLSLYSFLTQQVSQQHAAGLVFGNYNSREAMASFPA